MRLREWARKLNPVAWARGFFSKQVQATDPVQVLARGLRECAEEQIKVDVQLAILQHNQSIHNHAINRILERQRAFFEAMNDRAMDTSMPDLDKAKPDPKDAEAKARAAAAQKPN